jgi:hypothetical protein
MKPFAILLFTSMAQYFQFLAKMLDLILLITAKESHGAPFNLKVCKF